MHSGSQTSPRLTGSMNGRTSPEGRAGIKALPSPPTMASFDGRRFVIGDRTRTAIIIVVTAVWAINFAAGLFVEGYKPSESINGIFMVNVGSLFALGGV